MKEVNLAIFKPAVDTFTSEHIIRNRLLLIFFKENKIMKNLQQMIQYEAVLFLVDLLQFAFSSGFDNEHISSRFFYFFRKVYRNHLFKLQTTIKCMEMKMLLSLMHVAIRGIKTHSY